MFSAISKILLVEDNPGDTRLFREMLSGEPPGSFDIEYVTTLADAMERLDRGGIDVVLLDLGLPDSQGLDTFSRAYAHSPQMPFVVLTGLADETIGIAALSQGAQDYLRKGEVDGKLLLRSIRYATERKRAGEALRQAHDELELRVDTRTADLTRALGQLQEEIAGRKLAERALQKAHDDLELKVALRTAELVQANRELQSEMEERRRVEKTLAGEQQRLFAVLDSLPVFVYLKGLDYTIRFANRIFLETFGPSIGKRCYEALMDRTEPCRDCQSFELLKTGRPQEWEWHWRDGDRIFQIYDYPFTDIDGSSLILTLGIDITARKQAEDSLRYLASQLMTAQERERKRISRDLHDILGGGLVSLKLQAKDIGKKLTAETEEIKNEIKSDCGIILSCLDGLIEKVRHISRDLSPAILEDLGVTAAIRHLFDQFEKRHKTCRCTLEADEIDDLFTLEDRVNLYRVFQEALTNIAKYARATEIFGVVKRKEDKVFFRVEDNGKGFDVDHALTADVTGRGLGLASMQERVRMLGSDMQIWSEAGKGTRISFTVPISKNAENSQAAH